MKPRVWLNIAQTTLLAVVAMSIAGCGQQTGRQASGAEAGRVRLIRQYGLAYLPLIVAEDQRLIEQHAKQAGLGDVKVEWTTLTGGSAATDALLSGSADYIATGITPLITLWDKTNGEVRGVAGLDASPIYLNTVNSSVKSVSDLSPKDRIAVPAVKVSVQAVVLQMAAAKAFGDLNYTKLDPLTVTMKHPDAMEALLSGHSEITAHLATAPYGSQELRDRRVSKVLSSFEVLGGPHTLNVLSTTNAFRQANPKTDAAVLAALEEAVGFIQKNKRAAAELYVKSNGGRENAEEIVAQLDDPELTYTTVPRSTGKFAAFMKQTGAIKRNPTSWKDLFFDGVHSKDGS